MSWTRTTARIWLRTNHFQNGPDAYDLIMSQVVVAPTTDDVQSMRIEFWLTEIVCDVGVSANTVKDALKLLRFLNADFPLADRFTDDQICEKLLKMISVASSLLGGEAKKELDAVEGVPGLPRVREFQLPAVGGAPRARDLNGVVVYFHAQWEAAVKAHRARRG